VLKPTVKLANHSTSQHSSTAFDMTTYSTSSIMTDRTIDGIRPAAHEQQNDFYRNQDNSYRLATDPKTFTVSVFKTP